VGDPALVAAPAAPPSPAAPNGALAPLGEAAPLHEPAPLREVALDTVPFCWQPSPRDVALDLLRGLAMVILVVNHIHLDSGLEVFTGSVLSAAEILVAVSGVVVGMVFGRRWLTSGPRATTRQLLLRSRKLYLASVVVVAIIGLLTLVPGLPMERLTVSGNAFPRQSSYEYESLARTLLAVITLEAGPWQFNILGFFVAMIAAAPLLLWALARGWWPAVLGLSWLAYLVGRQTGLDVLPSQSERPFGLLVWQLLFVHGMVLAWYRGKLRHVPGVWIAVAALAGGTVAVQLALGPQWQAAHFDKSSLDLARAAGMTALTAVAYLALRRAEWLGKALIPFGRNSFYVFIMHVFVCLAVAVLFPRQGFGMAANTVVQLGCLALLWLMVRRRFLFRWVPR
jgi:hypothetical protein